MNNNLIYVDKTIGVRERTGANYFEWIDILRGLAAIGVVIFHSRVDLWVGWQEIQTHPEHFSTLDRTFAWLSIPTPFLGSGVMLFFILSGFCIHYPSALNEKINLKSYFTRRLIRIYPPYLFTVAFSLLVEWICKSRFGQQDSNLQTTWKTIFMIQNYPPLPGQIVSNPSLWSLPVEVELYFFYPIAFLISRLIGSRLTLIFIGVLSFIALGLTLNGLRWLEGNFLQYWIIWCSGSVLAQATRQGFLPKWKKWHYIPMFLFFGIASITVIRNVPAVIGHFVWAIGYFLLAWFCLNLTSPTILFPRLISKSLFFLGKISYSVYLIHFPLFRLLGNIWIERYGSKPSNFLVCILASLIAIPVGSFFYEIVEKPTHKLAQRLGRRPID